MRHDLLQWFDYVVTHGHFAALSDNFYNYTPPYIYMMAAVSYLDGMFERITLIKSIPVVFDGIAAFLVFRIVFVARADRRLAAVSALLFLNLPTLILDGAVWGQFDIVYTTFMMAFVYYLIRHRPFLAMLMFAVAFTVKLQAVLLAPLVVYLLLAGEIPWLAVWLVPLTYTLLILPAALAGRGWIDLFTLYNNQVDLMHDLSAHAPNFYLFVQGFLSPRQTTIATFLGVALAGLVSVAVLATHFRLCKPLSPICIVLLATLWLGLEPSLLPRMHERYFLPADMFAFLFACLVPRAWWVAVLFQVGSGLAYSQYLASSLGHQPFDTYYAAHFGAVAMIAAMIGVAWFYWPYLRKLAPLSATASGGRR